MLPRALELPLLAAIMQAQAAAAPHNPRQRPDYSDDPSSQLTHDVVVATSVGRQSITASAATALRPSSSSSPSPFLAATAPSLSDDDADPTDPPPRSMSLPMATPAANLLPIPHSNSSGMNYGGGVCTVPPERGDELPRASDHMTMVGVLSGCSALSSSEGLLAAPTATRRLPTPPATVAASTALPPPPPVPLVELLLRGLNEKQVQQVGGLLALARFTKEVHGLTPLTECSL